MTPRAPVPRLGGVFPDQRDRNRWLRVSWHEDEQMYVLSTWYQDQCVAAFQLAATDVPGLIDVLGHAASADVELPTPTV